MTDELRATLSRQSSLLTAFGRIARDFQLTLEGVEGGYQEPNDVAFFDPANSAGSSLLARVQHDILHLVSPSDLDGQHAVDRTLGEGDDSISVHACHGPLRQVEVLRDVLLDAFDRDPTLQPREVIVMTPDLPTFAPLIAAIFGQGRDRRVPSDPSGGGWGDIGAPRIPVSIADLGVRALNPIAEALMRLLTLVDARVTVSALVDLLSLAPVHSRFGIAGADVATTADWLREAGARWAFDADERARAGLPADPANTIGFALDRLALGVVMSEDEAPFCGVLAFDRVGTDEQPLLGAIAEACGVVAAAVARLGAPRSIADWAAAIRQTIDEVISTESSAGWELVEVTDALSAIGREAATSGAASVVDLVTLRAILDARFSSIESGDRPITGAVTVSALAPMRSVPFRVVCLLGMDDGVFPRSPSRPGFDLTTRTPRIGDRDSRDEDRHLILEALLSARDRLIVVYTGHDVRTGELRAPAVPIGELLDVLDASFSTPRPLDGREAQVRDAIVIDHPLQPFSTVKTDLRRPARVSFDGRMRAARDAQRGLRVGPRGLFDDGPLPPIDTGSSDVVSVDDLTRFLRHPIRYLLRRRLGLWLDDRVDVDDREPIELDALERWNVGDRMMRWAIARSDEGVAMLDWDAAYARFAAEGSLPLGTPGKLAFRERVGEIDCAIAAARALLGDAERSVTVSRTYVAVEPGDRSTLVEATFDRVVDGGEILHVVTGAPDKPRHILRAWVELLVAPQTISRARIIGAVKRAAKTIELERPGDAEVLLRRLLVLSRRGLAEPLPLFERCSSAYARTLRSKRGKQGERAASFAALQAAVVEWESGFQSQAEGEDPDIAAVFPAGPPFVDDDGEPHGEFVALAESVWGAAYDACDSAGDRPRGGARDELSVAGEGDAS